MGLVLKAHDESAEGQVGEKAKAYFADVPLNTLERVCPGTDRPFAGLRENERWPRASNI